MYEYTFGKSNAAINLCEILKESNLKWLSRKVSPIYHDFKYDLHQLSYIKDKVIFKRCALLLRNFYYEKIEHIHYVHVGTKDIYHRIHYPMMVMSNNPNLIKIQKACQHLHCVINTEHKKATKIYENVKKHHEVK